MYRTRSSPIKGATTLVSSFSLFWILSVFILQASTVASRNVHNHLLYTRFTTPLANLLIGDQSQPEIDELLEEWASVQSLLDASERSQLPTPSRQHIDVKPTPSGSLSSLSIISPTALPRSPKALNDSKQLQRRNTFTSNVCPISTQTTIFVSVDGTSTVTVSITVGPRPTGIPGDSGTSDGTDPTGGSTGSSNTSGQSFGDKEGLIAGLTIVILILLASFCTLCVYFYKRRRNARLQRLSMQNGTDPAEVMRRMGSKGFMNISAQGRNLTRLWRRPRIQIGTWSPVPFFTGAIRRLKESTSRNEQRDSQSSELLEWKRQMGRQNDNYPWSEAEVPVIDVNGEKSPRRLSPLTQSKRASPSSIPDVISSPVISDVQFPLAPKPAARPISGEPSRSDFVPLVERRVPSQQPPLPSTSAVRPVAIEPVRTGSTPDLRRETSPRRASTGEPLSPSAWMAGFGLASAANIDPFNNPSYMSSSDHHTSISGHSGSRISEVPTSPRSQAHSFMSDRTPRGRWRLSAPLPPLPSEALSTVSEHGTDVRPDGASDIMSTLGSAFHDRSGSRQSITTINTTNDVIQTVPYHPLSDVEEVLTPVADERLSLQPPWRSGDSFGQRTSRQLPSSPISRPTAESPSPPPQEASTFRNPFTDENEAATVSAAPVTKMRRPAPARKKSEATSLAGGVLPSEKSGSISVTGTSIFDAQPIDTTEWDANPSARRKESEQLFYYASPSSVSGSGSGSGSGSNQQRNR